LVIIMITADYRKHREEGMKQEKSDAQWLAWEDRYIQTYLSVLGEIKGPVLDIGCGTNHLARAFKARGIEAEGIDVDRADFEKDKLPYEDNQFQTATLHAIIEHLFRPDNLMKELSRVIAPGGIIIIRTTRWQSDFRNFYNDPTHVKPYTPVGLTRLLKMYDFETFFLEPGLICKSHIYWKFPKWAKWHVAKWIRDGTRSMIVMAENLKPE